MATAAELAGTEAPPGCDSISFVPTLKGQGVQAEHEWLYWEFHERNFTQAALLIGRWKGIRTGLDGPVTLYDLETDVGEATDVATKHPEVVERIAKYLSTARSESSEWPAK